MRDISTSGGVDRFSPLPKIGGRFDFGCKQEFCELFFLGVEVDEMSCVGHSHDGAPEDEMSLNDYIDKDGVRVLNASDASAASLILKPHSQRFVSTIYLCSNEDDPELILHVPFVSQVRMQSISIIGGLGGSAPMSVSVFVNRDDVDFTNASDLTPTQVIELVDPDEHTGFDGTTIDYPLRAAKFNGVDSVTLFFPDCLGADHTALEYVGFKGVGSSLKRGIVRASYEVKPQIADHKTPASELGSHIGGLES